MKTNILAEPALVDRERELDELLAYLNSVLAGKGTTVFVSGEAGAGKTRLVTEFLGRAKKHSVTVLKGWCLSNAAVPYFPFFEAFSQYFSSEPQSREVELKNWLMGPPQERFSERMVTPQVWKDQTFTAVANTLASISAKQPVILFIDDLHWADSASLALIHYLANSISQEKVLVLATFRNEQVTADSGGKPHPLLETIRLMRRQDLLREINVTSLNEVGVSKLVGNMLGGGVEHGLAQKMASESQGNPLFIVESVRMLHERNGLVQENERWCLTSGGVGIPPKIKDIILQRLGVLRRDQRSLLEVAAVIGEKFDAQSLARVLGQDQIEVIKALDEINRDTSLVRFEGELYRFDHGRTCDAIYDDISPALKRGYHAKVAETLENTSEGDGLPFNDLAYQFAQAGNKEKAVKYALLAGQDALEKWSNNEAIKHFIFVVQSLGDSSSQQKSVALEGLGDAYFANNNFQQAIEIFQQVADIQDDAGKIRALRKALQASFYQGDVSIQQTLIAKAEKLQTADRLEAARVAYQKWTVSMSPTNWAETESHYLASLGVYEEEYALSDVANILLWTGFGEACIGKLELGVANNLRAIALCEDLGDFRSQMEAYAYAGGSFQACMFMEQSNKMLAKALQVNEQYKIWDYVKIFPALVWEAMNYVQTDIPKAIDKAKKALEYFKRTDSYLYAGPVHGILIVAYALAGDTAHVDEYFAKLMSLPPHILQNAPTQVYIGPTMLTYYAAKGDYAKMDQAFNDWQKMVKAAFPSPFVDASSRQLYAWGLSKQGKTKEAQAQLAAAAEIIESARKRFLHTNIVASAMTRTNAKANQTIPVRLDLVNVAFAEGSVVAIEGLPEGLKIHDVPPNCVLVGDRLEFKDKTIKPFEVKTVTLKLKAAKPTEGGSFPLNPKITYTDELGTQKTTSPRQLTITIQPTKPSRSESLQPKTGEKGDSEIDILKRFGLTRS